MKVWWLLWNFKSHFRPVPLLKMQNVSITHTVTTQYITPQTFNVTPYMLLKKKRTKKTKTKKTNKKKGRERKHKTVAKLLYILHATALHVSSRYDTERWQKAEGITKYFQQVGKLPSYCGRIFPPPHSLLLMFMILVLSWPCIFFF